MPVVKTTYVPDNESFGKFLLSEQVSRPVEQASHEVRLIARDLTPYDASDQDGPHMRDMFVVQKAMPWVSKKGIARVSYRVINTHRAAAAIEFGFSRAKKATNRKGRRMLGRAGARVGEMRDQAGT
jgi:hypothetical protein